MTAQAEAPVQRERAVNLGPLGWVAVLWRATGITFSLAFKAVKASAGGSKARHDLAFYDYMAYGGMRDYQSGLNAVGIQNLLPTTATTCAKVAKKRGIPHTAIRLPDGTVAVRLGPQRAKKVIVCFHGGAYMSPALPLHVEFAFGFADTFPSDTSVFILQYGLASDHAHHYPLQLQQAAALMEYLLHTEQTPASAITLVGDSAGAHLAVGLLLHLRHPNPQVPTVKMDGQISGAALISPWVINMDLECDSIKVNKDKDLLSKEALKYWTGNFMGSSAPDCWNSLLTVPPEWWADLPVKDILITYGDNEMLRDGAIELCKAVQAGHTRTTARNFPGELHAHMLMNRFLHINKPCESERVFREWLDGRLNC